MFETQDTYLFILVFFPDIESYSGLNSLGSPIRWPIRYIRLLCFDFDLHIENWNLNQKLELCKQTVGQTQTITKSSERGCDKRL